MTRTGSDVFLEGLKRLGVDYIFANLGTDHAGFIESIARHEATGALASIPEVVLAPHEMVAVSAAHGYTLMTGRPQAVVVHVDVGTANAAAGLHNARRSRIPMLVYAGRAPATWSGNVLGGRDESVHFIQDLADQGGIVRSYVKWEYEIRGEETISHVLSRALALAQEVPAGPVYLTAAREVLERLVESPTEIDPIGMEAPFLPDEDNLRWLLGLLQQAERPVLLTSYAGGTARAVEALVRFAERFALPVVEVRPDRVNFPTTHPLHHGYAPREWVESADLILIVGCDVPWVPRRTVPPGATVVVVDEDPLQTQLPVWPFPVSRRLRGNITNTLEALNALSTAIPGEEGFAIRDRRQRLLQLKEKRSVSHKGDGAKKEAMSAEAVTAAVAEVFGAEAVYVVEAVTNMGAVLKHLPRNRPGGFWSRRGSALGWALGAALGVKLAAPDRDVVALVGDGAYIFGVPSAAHWAQAAWKAPSVTVIYNNGGWKAVGASTLRVYPTGAAATSGRLLDRFPSPPDLSQVVKAAGGVGWRVTEIEALLPTLQEAKRVINRGVPAVVDVGIEA